MTQKHLNRQPVKEAIRYLEEAKLLESHGVDPTNKVDAAIKTLKDELERTRSGASGGMVAGSSSGIR